MGLFKRIRITKKSVIRKEIEHNIKYCKDSIEEYSRKLEHHRKMLAELDVLEKEVIK